MLSCQAVLHRVCWFTWQVAASRKSGMFQVLQTGVQELCLVLCADQGVVCNSGHLLHHHKSSSYDGLCGRFCSTTVDWLGAAQYSAVLLDAALQQCRTATVLVLSPMCSMAG